MMPSAARELLRPHIRRQSLKQQHPIYIADDTIDTIYFPIDNVISVVTDLADGETSEAGIIGREGTTGHVLALGQSTSAQRLFVQVAGTSASINAADFRTALEFDRDLRAYTLRYTQATIASLSQWTACNVLHPATERCARWLLNAHDRAPGDVVNLTQEFLGQMLGLRRGSVALAASALQEAGAISYMRGQISILSRAGLEAVSCECYRAVENRFERIMGYSVSKSDLAT